MSAQQAALKSALPRTLGGCLDESHCYTLEVSFYSYTASTTGQATPYTEEAYMKLGRNLARTFLDYYKLLGYISSKPSSSMLPKPGNSRPRPDRRDNRSQQGGDSGAPYSSTLPTERSLSDTLQRGEGGSGGGGGQYGGRFDRGLNREERSLRRSDLSINGGSLTESGLQKPRRF